MTHTWSSLHAYLHGGTEQQDDFLIDHVAPAAEAAVRDGEASGWFFIRYWAGGPHLRIRLRDATPGATGRFAAGLRDWLRDHPSGRALTAADYYGTTRPAAVAVHGWHEHGLVELADYEPETARYGGLAAIGAAEDLFVAATRVAVAAVRASRRPGRRLGVAFNLLAAFGDAVCDSGPAEVAMLRRYVLSARYNTQDTPALDPVAARDLAEREYARDTAGYRRVADAVRSAVAAGRPGYVTHWAATAGGYARRVRELAAVGELTGPGSAWTVLLSQLHMLHNRLGVELAEEYYLAWLASLVRTGAALGAGFHDSGLDTPSRRHHEHSKYFPVSLDAALPRTPARPGTVAPPDTNGTTVSHSALPDAGTVALPDAAPSVRRAAQLSAPPATDTVALPDAEEVPLARPDLVSCLRFRRSSLTGYGGTLAVTEVSALLSHATAERTVNIAGSLEVAVRPYPSAGALRATRVLLVPTRVPGLEPAVYEHRPADNTLRRIAPAPAPDLLASSSPYLDRDRQVALEADTVPLWLFVVGDVAAVTARYGQRGYRFLLLEVGHLAQNLALVGTALGLRSVTIGAFHDDLVGQYLDLDGVNEAPFYLLPVAHE